jgi:hypothetical protein
MATLGLSPFTWLEFDADGALVDPAAQAALAALVAPPGVSDLVVISHGWKNTKAEATTLCSTLWTNACKALEHKTPAAVAICGVLWPAKAYQDDFDTVALASGAGGQTLGLGSAGISRDLTDGEFAAVLADFRDVFGDKGEPTLAAATEAADAITGARSVALFAAAATAIGAHASSLDSELVRDADPIATSDDPHGMLLGLAQPPTMKVAPNVGGTQGLSNVVGQVIQGSRAAVARFLNQLTYFEMKQRAGVVGARLGSVVLPALAPSHAVRLHLVGHSFGARLVTAAASALPANMPVDFFSLTLLQGAFSQNALAAEVKPGVPGAFRNVIGRPTGPIAITHTHNDLACTLAYALASRLSRDTTTAIGDKDDIFGAMGANGAQKLSPSVLAADVTDQTFAPKRGLVNGFLADAYIFKTATSDAHNNITNPTCGKLVAAVIESSSVPV